MRTFSFVTIFSIEKCSVRLGAFGAKLRRVESSGSGSDRIRIGTHNNYNPPENCKILCVFQRKITRSDVFFVWGVLQDLFLCIFLALWPLIILAGRPVKNTHKSVRFLLSSAGENIYRNTKYQYLPSRQNVLWCFWHYQGAPGHLEASLSEGLN